MGNTQSADQLSRREMDVRDQAAAETRMSAEARLRCFHGVERNRGSLAVKRRVFERKDGIRISRELSKTTVVILAFVAVSLETSARGSDGPVLSLEPGLAFYGTNALDEAGGPGGSIRVGYHFKSTISIVPELKLTGWRFTPSKTFYPSVTLLQAKIGARVMFGKTIRPTLSGHMGYTSEASDGGHPDSFSARGGLGFDVGVGIAFRLSEQFELGPSIELNRITNGNGDSFVNAGLLLNVYF